VDGDIELSMTKTDQDYLDRIVDEQALREFLTEELGPVEEFDVQRHNEGHSNETLFVTWGDRDLVIRRPPPGKTADNAHDVLREYHVIDSLQATSVRVPGTVVACDDHDVIGSDFYAMDHVEGRVLRTSEPDEFADPDSRRQLSVALVDQLVNIHSVDYEAVGLESGEFGYPPEFTQRQVNRWTEQLTWAFEVTADEREVPELYDIGEWLSDNVPGDDAYPNTLVHGDYKLDNVLFRRAEEVKVAAVFDWEMATLGDPFTDLGWMLSYWHDEGDPEPPTDSLTSDYLTRDGYLSRRELVARYEAATGYEFENWRFYWVLATYKLAGLGEMFFRRYLEGNSADPMYPKMEDNVPALADRALAIIDGEISL
jgi:aminoglycoside phosphotransferase (APT) family kinase protein